MVAFSSLLDKVDIYYEIIKYLETRDIVRTARICTQTRDLYRNGFTKWFNVYSDLSWFFKDPTKFRVLQAETGAIVSGSFALQFFTRQYFEEANLDIYVHYDAKELVGAWLLGEGYSFFSCALSVTEDILESDTQTNTELYDDALAKLEMTSPVDAKDGVLGALNFKGQVKGKERRVMMLVVEGTPLKAIMESNSTCVLNFLTFDSAFCLYPRATLVEKKSLLLKDPDVPVTLAMSKYEHRGFQFVQLAEEGDDVDLFRLKEVRWIVDSGTWTFRLPVLLGKHQSLMKYCSPAWSTSWAITTYIEDYHRIRCQMWYDDPCIFPILYGSDRIRARLVDLLVENEDQFTDTDHHMNGSDRNTQRFLTLLKESLGLTP